MSHEGKNPFNWGKIALGDNFADHKELLKELLLDALSGQNLILYGPRRIGKTSLINEIFSQLQTNHNYQAVIIDLFENNTIETITGKIFHDLAGNVSKASELAKKVIKGIGTKSFGDSLELTHPSSTELLIQTLNLIKSESQKGKKIIIAFDEFQEMEKIDPNLIKILRSQIQTHQFITYIFTGSHQKLIDMFIDQDQPFYKFGKLVFLQKPDSKEIEQFLERKFISSQISISNEIISTIITKTKNLPYYTFLLAHELWNNYQLENLNAIQMDTIEFVVDKIIRRYTKIYEEYWSNLTKHQRTALKIISKEYSFYKQDVLKKFKVTPASIQRAVDSLLKQQLILKQDEKLEFLDPFFELWIFALN